MRAEYVNSLAGLGTAAVTAYLTANDQKGLVCLIPVIGSGVVFIGDRFKDYKVARIGIEIVYSCLAVIPGSVAGKMLVSSFADRTVTDAFAGGFVCSLAAYQSLKGSIDSRARIVMGNLR